MKDERTSLLGSSVNNDNTTSNTNTNTDDTETRCSIRFNIESNNNDNSNSNDDDDDDKQNLANPDFAFFIAPNNYQGRRNTVVSWAGTATATTGTGPNSSTTIDGITPSHRRRATANSGLFRRSAKTAPVVEMGRRELYAELPFVAVLGLQKQERSLSMAWSNAAALLENEESCNASMNMLLSTTEKPLDPNEKEERVRRMSVILLDEMEGSDGVYLTLPLVVAVMIASMFTFNVGYSIGIMNTTEKYVFPGHSMEIWSLAVSVWCVGGLVGARLSGKWADTYGRKRALLLTAWPFVVGGWLQTCSLSMSMIVLARAIIGVACGATTVLVPIYLGELAPPNLRGYIGTMTQFTMVFGILFSDVLSFFFANDDHWRFMVLPTAFCGMCPLLLESFLYESPRFLLGRDPDSEEARYIIQKLRGFRYDDEIETEVDHFLGALQSQSLNSGGGGGGGGGKRGDGKGATAELFSDRSVRLQLISSLLLQVSKMMSGITAVFFYSSLFFQGVIENPLVGTTILGGINVCATYLALDLLNRYGRRTLLMVSSGGMCFSCVLLILSFHGYFGKSMPLIAVAMCVLFYGIGIGPIPNLIVTEMFVAKYVSTAMSVCMQLSWASNFFVGLFFPLMMKTLGAYSFGPFALVLFFTFVYAWIWLPETQGTTPAELQARLVKRMSTVTYHQLDMGSSIAKREHNTGCVG